MDKFKVLLSQFGLLCGLGLVVIFFNSYAHKEGTVIKRGDTASNSAYVLPQVMKPPRIKKELYFAGEVIPMNIDTKERLEKEFLVNSYYHSSTILSLKNATRYFPIIESILAEEGIPTDFKYLCVAESNLSNAVSPAGAKGFWQFMNGAAKDYGLEVNGEVDERYHIEKSTRAAAKYLQFLKNKFGTWIDAAAAYNMGQGNLEKNIREQGEDSFFDLNLNAETSRYIFRLVAIKEVMESPNSFGFYLEPDDYYEPWNVYETEITSSLPDLGAFARQNGVTYRILKYYNPWLIDSKLTVKANTYMIKFPRN